VAFVVAAALGLIVFVVLANLLTVQFTRGATRAALDEGIRLGSRSETPVADCEARARAVLRGLLGPVARADVAIECAVVGSPPRIRARSELDLDPWLPSLEPWSFTMTADAPQEVLP
jgi:hypothetical protein